MSVNNTSFSCFAFNNPKFAQIHKYFAQLCDCMIAAFINCECSVPDILAEFLCVLSPPDQDWMDNIQGRLDCTRLYSVLCVLYYTLNILMN